MAEKRSLRVLHIDDDNIARAFFSHFYKANNIAATIVETPDKAIKELENGPRFDAIVTDLFIPEGMTNVTPLQLLKYCEERHPEVYRIVCSATTDDPKIPGVEFVKRGNENRLVHILNGLEAAAHQKSVDLEELRRRFRPILHKTASGRVELLDLLEQIKDPKALEDLLMRDWKPTNNPEDIGRLEKIAHMDDRLDKLEPLDPSALNQMDAKAWRNSQALKKKTLGR